MKDNSFVFFRFKDHMLWTRIGHQSEIYGLLSGWVRIRQISHVVFKPQVSFSLNFGSLFNVMRDKSSVLF